MTTHALPFGGERRRAAMTLVALLTALAVSTGLFGAARAEAARAPEGYFGVSGRHLTFEDLDAMKEAGVSVYRTLFHFSRAKKGRRGYYDWREFDKLVSRTASRGIQLLPLLYGTPRWIYPDGQTPPIYDPWARRQWSELLRNLAARYGPRGTFWAFHPFVPYRPITAWQIWNEPNATSFWERDPDPIEYAKLVALSADAIESVNPRATIVSAGLVHDPSEGMSGPDYLATLASQPQAREAIDRYGYHPYAANAPGVKLALREARTALATHGDPGAPIWITEVGWGSEGLFDSLLMKDRAGQARALETTFGMILRKRKRLGVQRVLWYYWRDHFDPLCFWCRSAGLLESSYERKPAFAVYRRHARG